MLLQINKGHIKDMLIDQIIKNNLEKFVFVLSYLAVETCDDTFCVFDAFSRP